MPVVRDNPFVSHSLQPLFDFFRSGAFRNGLTCLSVIIFLTVSRSLAVFLSFILMVAEFAVAGILEHDCDEEGQSAGIVEGSEAITAITFAAG